MKPGLALLCLFLVAAPSEAQVTEHGAESLPGPEAPSSQLVRVDGDLLSVSLDGAEVGAVIMDIAGKAGFEAEVDKSVYGKTLSTTFEDVDMERGILRLLNLVRERNYFFYYDTEGRISRLEVHGSALPKKAGNKKDSKAGRQKAPSRAGTQVDPQGTVNRQAPQPSPPEPLNEVFPEGIILEPPADMAPEDSGVPYIPPAQEPVYIPPAGGN